ncbi:MAG: molybdate ABC transporter substrate-binding protein, partial [Chloroflexota bacterium]
RDADGKGGGQDAPDLVVLAAASLRDVIPALAEPWAARHPGSALIATYDGSGALRARIEAGAPADLFAAADRADPQVLADACLTRGGPRGFAGNTLALAVRAGDPAGIAEIADLARPGLRIVGAAPSVPVARYTAQLLDAVAATQPDPAAWSAAVAANTVSLEDNVRTALARVGLGEADAAIVYATDIAADPALAAVPIPDALNVVTEYAAVVPAGAAQPALAGELLAFLAGPEGQAVLADAGFLPPPRP